MMHRIKLSISNEFKKNAIHSAFKNALDIFIKEEIIISPFNDQDVLENHQSLKKFDHIDPKYHEIFVGKLRDRVIEHNIRVISKYYKRISLSRMSNLISLSLESLEEYLSDLSSSNEIFLKIDRPAGIVSFEIKKIAEEILSDWSSDINKLLNLMESTCHLINRENMVYKA